jgi:hypothetical protein
MTGLNSQNVTATELDQPHPLDLLEDDGNTEVQGGITGYSYVNTVTTPTPEPSSLRLFTAAAASVLVRKLTRRHRKSGNPNLKEIQK